MNKTLKTTLVVIMLLFILMMIFKKPTQKENQSDLIDKMSKEEVLAQLGAYGKPDSSLSEAELKKNLKSKLGILTYT